MLVTIENITPVSGTEQYLYAVTGTSKEDCLFFDIETTGLSASSSFVFLIGCAFYDQKEACFVLKQYLIRHVQEEEELLRVFFNLAEQYRVLLHFNGQTFDLPFLSKRARALGLYNPLPDLMSVDLYQRYRSLKQLLKLPHMNQKSLEQFLGWQRQDQLDGQEVVSGYWEFSVSEDPDAGQPLLLHNHDDLLGLMRVTALEGFKALAEGNLENLTGNAESAEHRYLILRFRLLLPLPLADAWTRTKAAPPDGEYLLAVRGLEAELRIPVFIGKLLYFLPDYKNYYYLPLENQAIHKSLAAYVSRDCREKARPQTCFIPKTGRFLPQPEALISPTFRESYDSRTYYFEYTEEFLTGKLQTGTGAGKWKDYLSMLLKYLCCG